MIGRDVEKALARRFRQVYEKDKMLRFFRKIRIKLIDEGNLKRYLIYSIGEILLVMLGILFAVQVNNWNESNKAQKSELDALVDLREEFVGNVNSFEVHLADKQRTANSWKELILKISDQSLPDSIKGFGRGPSGTMTFIPSQSTLNKLIFTGNIDNIKNDSLRYLLSSWDNIFNEYQEDEDFHHSFVQNQLVPYEMGLTAYPFFEKSFQRVPEFTPFYTADEQKQLIIRAYKDLKYQNLLLRNHYWLIIVLEEGEKLQKTMRTIIKLLDSEIDSKK